MTWKLHSPLRRLHLSQAKHPSLTGHPRLAHWLSRQVPFYEHDEDRFFDSDGASADVVAARRAGFARLSALFRQRFARGASLAAEAAQHISDLQFTSRYRVPFQYSRYVSQHLEVGGFVSSSSGVELEDIDGNRAYDLGGSYGVNLFGYELYKDCIARACARMQALGPVLGPYHPVVAENARRLCAISGQDEVSFHMSGTEAVMQAVRLARYHTRKPRLVRFSGAYHGFWDDVQPGIGNPLPNTASYTLRELDAASLRVLRERDDIACVLINPLQALHPNQNAPSDSTLLGERHAGFDRNAYARWLTQLREVCSERGIALIFDEVFVGFRLARGGAQEYFRVHADLVTYGKTLGGGFPVGVICGRADLMRRYRQERPLDICFARGTFNSHPYVMGAMHELLTSLERPEVSRLYADLDQRWEGYARQLNERLVREDLPIQMAALSSIWTVCYHKPSRYNWLLQYYMRAEGLALSWIGTGRLIFSLNYSEQDMRVVTERIVAAARAMQADGFFWAAPQTTQGALQRQLLREAIAKR